MMRFHNPLRALVEGRDWKRFAIVGMNMTALGMNLGFLIVDLVYVRRWSAASSFLLVVANVAILQAYEWSRERQAMWRRRMEADILAAESMAAMVSKQKELWFAAIARADLSAQVRH